MIHTDRRTTLRNSILKMSVSVPKKSYQSWDSERSKGYKKLCGDAQKLVAKAAATEGQLSAKLSELQQYWAGEVPQ